MDPCQPVVVGRDSRERVTADGHHLLPAPPPEQGHHHVAEVDAFVAAQPELPGHRKRRLAGGDRIGHVALETEIGDVDRQQ